MNASYLILEAISGQRRREDRASVSVVAAALFAAGIALITLAVMWSL